MNFGPYILTLLESPREGLKAPKILWAKVQKQKKLSGDQFLNFGPVFPKLVYFGPHLSSFLKRPREGLQAPKTLWAKVHKQESNFDKILGHQILKFGPDFFETAKLWLTCFGILEKP